MIDSKGKEEIYHIVEELKKEGYTIVYITNVAEEMLLADRIIILHEGQIAEEIKREDLWNRFDVWKQYDMKVPMVVELLQKLREQGIEIDLQDYSLDELVKKLKEKILV